MTTTIPFIAYEISGLAFPTTTGYYNSGAVNWKILNAISGGLKSQITEAAAGGVQSSAFQSMTATAEGGILFNGAFKVSAAAAREVSVLGYSTISGNAQKAQASAQIAFYESSDVDHDATTNFVSNEHIDHTGVSITAGAGLTGGGTIASTRDIAVGAGTGIVVNADDIEVKGYSTISSNAKLGADHVASGNEYSAAYASAQALKAHAFHAKISSSYLAANHGWSQITSGAKRIVHSLSGVPNIVNITPSGIITFAYAVYNTNATDFTVAITAAGNRVIRWHAQI